jgi:hypothetical protein
VDVGGEAAGRIAFIEVIDVKPGAAAARGLRHLLQKTAVGGVGERQTCGLNCKRTIPPDELSDGLKISYSGPGLFSGSDLLVLFARRNQKLTSKTANIISKNSNKVINFKMNKSDGIISTNRFPSLG